MAGETDVPMVVAKVACSAVLMVDSMAVSMVASWVYLMAGLLGALRDCGLVG
jgi:hypothetical protein